MHTSAVPAASKNHPETTLRASKICILADDLTGACDAAAPFVRPDRTVRVWLGPSISFPASEPVQAIHTASRTLPPRDAATAVVGAAGQLPHAPDTLIFKKVDSTLRGPIAAELIALQQALNARAILFAPAFPATGRVVRNGVLEIRGSIEDAERRSVRDLFPAGLQSRIALVPNAASIPAALSSGKLLLLCDASTQDDLDAIARAALSLPGLLFAGSAGLANALAKLDSLPALEAPLPLASRVLFIAGTTHPTTTLQLDRLADLPASSAVQTHQLRIEPAPDAGQQIRDAFLQFQPKALFLTGGDTAQLAVTALGAHSFLLRGEFAPGVPWGIAQGGLLDGRIVITKSGGFGTPDLLCDILKALGRSA
jgi:uncharacterized protein YgbK (DUF1537 family)